MTRQMIVAAENASNTWNEHCWMARALAVSSTRPMVSATELFLIMLRNSLVSGGKIRRGEQCPNHCRKRSHGNLQTKKGRRPMRRCL